MLLVTYQCFIALSLYVQFVFNHVAIYLEGLTSLTNKLELIRKLVQMQLLVLLGDQHHLSFLTLCYHIVKGNLMKWPV